MRPSSTTSRATEMGHDSRHYCRRTGAGLSAHQPKMMEEGEGKRLNAKDRGVRNAEFGVGALDFRLWAPAAPAAQAIAFLVQLSPFRRIIVRLFVMGGTSANLFLAKGKGKCQSNC
jgi:hypothetical protein